MAPPIPQASAAVGVCMTYGCPHQPARYPRGVAVNCGMAQVCTLCCLSGGGHVYGLGLTGGGRSLGVVTSDLSIGDIVAGDCAPDSCGLSRWRGAVSHCWTKTEPPASERHRSVTAAVRARPGFPSLKAPPIATSWCPSASGSGAPQYSESATQIPWFPCQRIRKLTLGGVSRPQAAGRRRSSPI